MKQKAGKLGAPQEDSHYRDASTVHQMVAHKPLNSARPPGKAPEGPDEESRPLSLCAREPWKTMSKGDGSSLGVTPSGTIWKMDYMKNNGEEQILGIEGEDEPEKQWQTTKFKLAKDAYLSTHFTTSQLP